MAWRASRGGSTKVSSAPPWVPSPSESVSVTVARRLSVSEDDSSSGSLKIAVTGCPASNGAGRTRSRLRSATRRDSRNTRPSPSRPSGRTSTATAMGAYRDTSPTYHPGRPGKGHPSGPQFRVLVQEGLPALLADLADDRHLAPDLRLTSQPGLRPHIEGPVHDVLLAVVGRGQCLQTLLDVDVAGRACADSPTRRTDLGPGQPGRLQDRRPHRHLDLDALWLEPDLGHATVPPAFRSAYS